MAMGRKDGRNFFDPDFYNMALERPQSDPRGYGLLFVDASRKSGYGSMLSHSCNPSCEVRVCAVNGKLTLAMTTLRELTIGDEVTFDYNAVTESLHEYQAAVCLCGQGRCRGSFLHFATADCYQQVLNRNSPVAVRLSQLIKGCAKKVMADDDIAILKRHGFQTAAFGAVSVNRRKATNSAFEDSSLDSMDFVPIWLRTHVADILRYIEYERRALPIALISNQITRDKDENESGKSDKKKDTNATTKKEPSKRDIEKPIKGSKPEPTFFFFLRRKRESWISSLIEENKNGSMTGADIEREIKKMASAEWKTYDDKAKDHWKELAVAEWEKNGGKKKAALEQQRLKRLEQSKNTKESKPASKSKKVTNTKTKELAEDDTNASMKKISFQAADAEGVTAMEQRIQQVTQALSRVGRVLDRHREEHLRKQQVDNQENQVNSPAALRELAHSPLEIMATEHVVAWMWNHEDGIVRTLLRMAENEICVSPDIKSALRETESKYASLCEFGTPWEKGVHIELPMTPTKGRQLLDEALLEFRAALLKGIRDMATAIKDLRASARELAKKRKEKADKRKEQAEKIEKITTSSSTPEIRYAIKYTLNDIIDTIKGGNPEIESDNVEITKTWLKNYNKRFKLEKAADLLLMYRRTSTFFQLVPYEALQSTPIEVYAREVGNSVPRSVIEKKENDEILPEVQSNELEQDSAMPDENLSKIKQSKEPKRTGVCDPEDIISEVVVDYKGDYVLSQLLQWYNAGIDQKPGLPDILGCALLPSMEGCWTIDPTKGSNSATGIKTKYNSNIRPKLVEWLNDPFKRGNPWADDVRRGFVDKDDKRIEDASKHWLPIGSPVLDFLVTGDDHNLMDVLSQLDTESKAVESNQSDGLLSSVDHGRPAQAVSNWVQCENPACHKWRKIPWHVDIDMLSKKFVCSDHIWGLNPPSCDTPEEDWDENTDACVEADGSVKPTDKADMLPTIEETEETAHTLCKSSEFKVGVRFDVLRPVKEKWSIANVVEITSKKIKFHFVSTQAKNDVWLEKNSNRIAPLHTHTTKPKPRPRPSKKPQQGNGEKAPKLGASKLIKPEASDESIAEAESTKLQSGQQNKKLRIEDEEESDGMSFADMDDSDSDDDMESDDFDNKDGVVASNDKEQVDESPTVTDHSSSDGSHKRDFEASPAEHSDLENESDKAADQPKTGFIIPKKKKESSAKSAMVVPKNVIPKKQSSVPSGTSLISNTARQAMLDKKMEKKPAKHPRRPQNHSSPSKDSRQADRKKTHRDEYTSPQKRKAFSDLSPSQSRHERGSISNGPQATESPTKKGKNRRPMMSPKRSFKDKYSIEQRRERELYRDSTEYTAQGQNLSYQDPSGIGDHAGRDLYPNHPLNDRYSNEERREREYYRDANEYSDRGDMYSYRDSFGSRDHTLRRYNDRPDMPQSPSSDQRRGADTSNNRNHDYQSHQNQYETERGRSQYYERSHDQESHARYQESSMGYGDAGYDQRSGGYHNDRRINTTGPYNESLRFDECARRSEEESSAYASRSQENYHSPRVRGNNEREMERDNYYRVNDYEQAYPTHSNHNDYYRDDRHSPRRHRDSGSRKEKKRRRKFDGSDEYSRRLESYSYSQGRNSSNEDMGRDRYGR